MAIQSGPGTFKSKVLRESYPVYDDPLHTEGNTISLVPEKIIIRKKDRVE